MDYLHELLQKELKNCEMAVRELKTVAAEQKEGTVFCRTVRGTVVPYRKTKVEKDGRVVFRTQSLRTMPVETVQEQINRQHLRRQIPKYERNLQRLEKLVQDWEHPVPLKRHQIFAKESNVTWGISLYKTGTEYAKRWKAEKVTVFEKGQSVRLHNVTEENTIWHPEHLRHVTSSGELRRSKSEVILDELLRSMGLVYAYERPLYIENKRYLPDYTILRPSDLQPVFLEHYGLTGEGGSLKSEDQDTLRYALRNEEKRRTYQKAGIVPWKNLLYTYDLPDGSLDVRGVRKALAFFLNL